MNKQMSMVAIALSVLLVGLGGLLVGRYLLAPKSSSDIALLLDEKTRELDDRTKQIQDLEKETAQLRQDLEETAKQVGGLQDRLDQANRGVASIQDRLKSRSRSSQSARDTSTLGTGGRPDEAGKYEIIRSTSVFEEASAGARKVATIEKGTAVNIVRSVGDWLEVRSKRGNPPGYIRREDAMYIGPG